MKYLYNALYYFFIPVMLLIACSVPGSNERQQEVPVSIAEPIVVNDISPTSIETEPIQPGLKVTYFLEYFKRNVTYLQKMKDGEFKSEKGKPITQINHQFDKGEVFDSGSKQGVAVRLRGYMHFPESGTYSMQALSNDGMVLYISDELAINDPKQHSDQMSNIADITIGKPGWFPLSIDYFQRKGTAAFKLFWKTPGNAEFIIIPESAYGHIE